MSTYQVYDTTTGAIHYTLQCAYNHLDANTPEGMSYVIGSGSDVTHYVTPEGFLRERGNYSLEALPLPCVVTIDGTVYQCDTQPTFLFDVADTYLIEVDAGIKYLKKEFSYDYQP